MYQLAEIFVNYKPAKDLDKRPKITSSKDAADLFRSVWSERLTYCEEFVILLINRSNKVLGFSKIGTGGVSAVVTDPKLIFQSALSAHASGMILCHNHPSGNLTPSEADRNLTKKIKEVGGLLEIAVLDHIILTENQYYSFADEGIF